MRAYTAADEEALHILKLLKDWTSLGFLEEAQRQTMQQDIPCGLRRTNGFLRIVLFLFTLTSAVASVALFFVIWFPNSDARIVGTFLLIFAAVCYAGAEFTVSRFRFYRHGIEEGLATVLSQSVSFGRDCRPRREAGLAASIRRLPPAGAIASYLLYARFGFQYLILAAMAFVTAIPQHWTSSHSGQHLIVAAFYLAGLAIVTRIRPAHRFDYLNDEYSVIEALLWLGLYLSLNLRLIPLIPSETTGPFYWTTFAIIWLLPLLLVLWRSLAIKDAAPITNAIGLVLRNPDSRDE